MEKLSRPAVLAAIEKIGKSAANHISNGAWEGWNTEYEQLVVKTLRIAYRDIRNGCDMFRVIGTALNTIRTGITYNHLKLIQSAASGYLEEDSCWKVINDELTFIPKN